MNKSNIFRICFIILFAFIIFVIGSLPDGSAWASTAYQTVPILTPTPNCELYELSDWEFLDLAQMRLFVTNGDVVDTNLTRIRFDWDYAEEFGDVNGYSNMSVDWFRWVSDFVWGGDNGITQDYDSITDTSADSPSTWLGPLLFIAGDEHRFQLDFEGDWGNGGPLTSVLSSDFGVIFDFDNGCQLRRDAIPRDVETLKPTNTATNTPTNTPTPINTPTPTNTPTTEGEPPEEPGDTEGEYTFFGATLQESLGLIIGLGLCILIGGGLVGGLIAWWIIRGRDKDEEEESDQ